MGQEYSMEVVERAEELYCVEGHTFESVATLTGVAASTLKRWSERYGWPARREEIRQAMASIRSNTIRLRAKLIENCLTTMSAQDAFAVSALENLALKAVDAAMKGRAASPQVPENPREIKTDEDAVAALEEAIQIKLNAMLTNPGAVSLSAIKEVKTVRDMIRDMRAQVAAKETIDTPRKKGLTLDAVNELRKEILGIKG